MPIAMALETNNEHLHFVLFPFLAQGHMIPMIDIAKLVAQRGVMVTIVTTHKNADRFEVGIDRAIESGLRMRLVRIRFPSVEVGLPEGCENLDMMPEGATGEMFFEGVNMMHTAAEEAFGLLEPRPSCIVSDMCFTWTLDIANKYGVPRVTFSGFSSFFLACLGKVRDSNVMESGTEAFVVPGLPDSIEFTKDQMVIAHRMNNEGEILGRMAAADRKSYGAIVNSFKELEPGYAEEYRKSMGGKAWCVGPVSLCNQSALDKAQRGYEADLDEHACIKWLNTQKRGSVVYACMGSLCNLTPAQMTELGLGLEASGRPFIWVIRRNQARKMEKWIEEEGFRERVKERGLLIQGWAPQVVILSHPAIGAFLTHCGWNSTIESICAGLPMIIWPLFGDQFGNQKLVEKVLKIGVTVGAGAHLCMEWGEENKIGVLVKMEDIEKAIEKIMDEGEEGQERRNRATKLGEQAKRAVKLGGSSYNNVSLLIQDIKQHLNNHV